MLRRFSEDRIGLFSVFYIVAMVFIAIFAYWIAPDSSPNANQMHLSIHSKPPGFSTQILILPNPNADQGTEEIAIDRLFWKQDQLFYNASRFTWLWCIILNSCGHSGRSMIVFFLGYYLFPNTAFQSFINASIPLSVKGCVIAFFNTSYGTVAI